MTPYFSDHNTTIYLGDCREILPQIDGTFSAVITDPVWPNVPKNLIPGWEAPLELFREAMNTLGERATRIVCVLGCDSDPRFLQAIPPSMPFFRVAMLEYVLPIPKGRVLNGFEVAYCFGKPPSVKNSSQLLPGKFLETSIRRERKHPCPRNLEHMKWLVRWYGEAAPILDLFAGSGTTLVAAKILGLPSIGIEIHEPYAERAATRISDLQKNGFIDFSNPLK